MAEIGKRSTLSVPVMTRLLLAQESTIANHSKPKLHQQKTPKQGTASPLNETTFESQ
jgi:hypothetical protein